MCVFKSVTEKSLYIFLYIWICEDFLLFKVNGFFFPFPCKFQVSVLTTLERRFNLQSADVGVIASSFEIGNLALILFVSYFGARAHRPRLIGCGGIVMALGALLSALPEFLTNQYEYKTTEVWRNEPGRDMCSNVTIRDMGDDGLCSNKANTNMMYLLLIGAQVLLGIGATPVQPLGVSYIDDHVRKKDSSLYIGKSYFIFGTLEWQLQQITLCLCSNKIFVWHLKQYLGKNIKSYNESQITVWDCFYSEVKLLILYILTSGFNLCFFFELVTYYIMRTGNRYCILLWCLFESKQTHTR